MLSIYWYTDSMIGKFYGNKNSFCQHVETLKFIGAQLFIAQWINEPHNYCYVYNFKGLEWTYVLFWSRFKRVAYIFQFYLCSEILYFEMYSIHGLDPLERILSSNNIPFRILSFIITSIFFCMALWTNCKWSDTLLFAVSNIANSVTRFCDESSLLTYFDLYNLLITFGKSVVS